MQYNQDLIKWLRKALDGETEITIGINDNTIVILMMAELLSHRLIERADGMPKSHTAFITYRLTAIGEIALNTPAPDAPANGEAVYTDDELRAALRYVMIDHNGQSTIYVDKPFNKFSGKHDDQTLDADEIESNRCDAMMHTATERGFVELLGGDSDMYSFATSDYELTPLGKAFMEAQPAAPQADNEAQEGGSEPVYTWGMAGMVFKYELPLQRTPNHQTAKTIADILNDETAALRSQLQAAQRDTVSIETELKWTQERRKEDIAALQAANDKIAALEGVVNQSHTKVAEARDKMFDREYASADSALKNAEVILARYTTDTAASE